MRPAAALLCVAMLGGCRWEADFSGNLKTETLNADDYRSEIMTIDRLLFTPEPLGNHGIQLAQQTITDLAKRIREKSDSRFTKLESLELKLLASHVGDLSPDDSGAKLQNDWMRIRSNLFEDRWWFARSAADLKSPKVSAPSGTPAAPSAARTVFTPTGRWRVAAITANGKERADDEMSGSVWSFDDPRLYVDEKNGTQTIFNFAVEGNGYLRVTKPSGKEGWMKYEMSGRRMRVAFFDNLEGGKPEFFDKPNDSDPPLILVVLFPAR